jgi:hypothetical protein
MMPFSISSKKDNVRLIYYTYAADFRVRGQDSVANSSGMISKLEKEKSGSGHPSHAGLALQNRGEHF